MTSPQTHEPVSPAVESVGVGSLAGDALAGDILAGDTAERDALQASLITLGHTFVALDAALAGPALSPTSPAGLGLTGALTLVVVAMAGPARPSAIAQVTGLSTGGVTLLLDRLERDGLLQRAYGVDPRDRRAVIVSLTEAGRRTLADLDAVVIAQSSDLVADLRSLQRQSAVSIPARSLPAQRTPAGAAERSASGPQVSGAAPPLALMTLFGLVNVFDAAILQVVGEGGAISVTDPRPITLIFDMHRAGELWLNDIPGLIGRSRGTVHTLLRQMEAEGLTERFRASAGTRSGVKVRLTAAGTGLVQSLLHTLLGQLPAVSAAIDNFVGSIPR